MGNLKEHVTYEHYLQLISKLEKDNATMRTQLDKIYAIISVGIFVAVFVIIDIVFLLI